MQDKTVEAWFPVKRYGYGVGLPIAWQGWLTLVLYLAVTCLSGLLLSKLTTLVILAVLTPIVLLIAYFRSDDEWRWRDGT